MMSVQMPLTFQKRLAAICYQHNYLKKKGTGAKYENAVVQYQSQKNRSLRSVSGQRLHQQGTYNKTNMYAEIN